MQMALFRSLLFRNRFSNLDPSFDFSSRSIPLSSEPSAFYRNCLSLLSSLRRKHGSLPADFSCKNLYSLLLDLPSASPRSSSFWATSRMLRYCIIVVGQVTCYCCFVWSIFGH